jgi:hypothetical protein
MPRWLPRLILVSLALAPAARAQSVGYVVVSPFQTYTVGQCISGTAAASLISAGYGNSLVRVASCTGSTTPVIPPASNQLQIIAATGTGQSDGSPLIATRTIITGTVTTATGVLQPGFNQTIEVVNQCNIPYQVYPTVGGTINGQAVNLPVPIPVGSTATFSSTDGVAWLAP